MTDADENAPRDELTDAASYRLDDQYAFQLRRAHQKALTVFNALVGDELTPQQLGALARLYELGPSSQNHLGRLTAMDVATIKGVVDRLRDRGLIETAPDPEDRRRSVIVLTAAGRETFERVQALGRASSRAFANGLTRRERDTLMRLLKKLAD
jgi:DNA-binding MarR family transcriptional regulator